MEWDEKTLVAKFSSLADDELLDQVTAYRSGMEPAAIDLIEKELHARGVSARKIAEYREACERECLYLSDGAAAMCSLCRKPAVKAAWGWQKIRGIVAIFPRWLHYCKEHCGK